MRALNRPRGVNATIECDQGQLFEVYYTFDTIGSIANGIFVPQNPVGEGTNGCPESIQYLPKNESNVYVPPPSTASGAVRTVGHVIDALAIQA